MPKFKGLRVEIQIRGDGLNASSVEEYESSECVKRSRGHTVHRVLRLPCGVQFQFLVSVDNDFPWKDANALKLRIDFDQGHEVSDAEIFVGRPDTGIALHTHLLCHASTKEEQIELSQISLPIQPTGKGTADFVDEELVSFQTIQTRDPLIGLPLAHGGGLINVAVYTCQLMPTFKSQPKVRGPLIENRRKVRTAVAQTNSTSRIVLFERIQHADIPHYFRSRKVDLLSLFVFHYHNPEEYERLKAYDQANYYIEDAGHGNRRVIPVASELDVFEGFADPVPNSQPLDPINTSEQPNDLIEDQRHTEDTDTIVFQSDDAPMIQIDDATIDQAEDAAIDAMDLDDSELPVSISGNLGSEDCDQNIHTDLAKLTNLKPNEFTYTELESMLDEEPAIRAQLEEGLRQVQTEVLEYEERIKTKNVKVVEVRKQKIEGKKLLEKKEEEVDKLKEDIARMEADKAGRDEEAERLKAVFAEMEAKNIESEQQLAEEQRKADEARARFTGLATELAALREQRDQQARILRKAEARKLQLQFGGA